MFGRWQQLSAVWLPAVPQSPLVSVRGLAALQQVQPKRTATEVDSSSLITGEMPRLSSAELRPFTEIPLAGGAVPLLGHYPIMRKHQGVQHLELVRRWFDELGPIFRVKVPCKRQLANISAVASWFYLVVLNMVFVYKPSAAEEVFRTEGPYPERIPILDASIQQVSKELNLPAMFTFM